MSRTGIHGGIRRGSAAAAVGAVLVLATGVPASQGDEGNPPSGSSSASVRQDAPGQDRGGKEAGKEPRREQKDDGGKPAKGAVAPSPVPSALSVPTALLPAVKASLGAAVTASPSAVPSSPLPLPSDAPGVPSPTLPAPIAPVPSPSSPETLTEGTASAAPIQSTAVPTPSGTPLPSSESGAQSGRPAAVENGPSPSVTDQPGAAVPGTDQPGTPAGTAAQAPAARVEAGATQAGAPGAGETVQPVQAQEPVGRTPQAAGTLPGSRQNVASYISTRPELQAGMVGLGLGLVGVGAAAGAVYLRLRKP